jgi:hypothetical protein
MTNDYDLAMKVANRIYNHARIRDPTLEEAKQANDVRYNLRFSYYKHARKLRSDIANLKTKNIFNRIGVTRKLKKEALKRIDEDINEIWEHMWDDRFIGIRLDRLQNGPMGEGGI